MPERSADDIQRDIEKSRADLAHAVDQLAYRTNPQRVVESTKQTLRAKLQTPQGQAVVAVVGGVVVLLVVKRVRVARRNHAAAKAIARSATAAIAASKAAKAAAPGKPAKARKAAKATKRA